MEAEDLLFRIREIYEILEPAEKKVADYILYSVTQIPYLSIGEIASSVNVSRATVNRFCKKAGFRGYRDFKVEVIRYVASQSPHIFSGADVPLEGSKTFSFSQLISYVISSSTEGLLRIKGTNSPEVFEKAVQIIISAKQVIIFGLGSSNPIALDAEQRLARLGVNCCAVTDSHFQGIKASLLSENDLVIAVSYSGRTADIYECLKIAKRKRAKIITITAFPTSPIAKMADICLLATTQSTVPPRESITSRISQMVIIDILCAGIYLNKNKELEKFLEEIELFLTKKRL